MRRISKIMVLRHVDREMTSQLRSYPMSKGMVSVAPVTWLPGALNATLPFFSVQNGILYFRADDPNLYGIVYQGGLTSVPRVSYNNRIRAGNKGCNFYSAPWAISVLPARDIGNRVEIKNVDKSVTDYITALYSLLGRSPIVLDNWVLEQQGFAKMYQVLQGDLNTTVGTNIYFGGTRTTPTQISGVANYGVMQSPLITGDFTYNGSLIPTYQMPYNTFYAIDTPIVLSAVDTANIQQPKLYFTLLNNVILYNNPNYSG